MRAGDRLIVSAPRTGASSQTYMATVPHGVRSGDEFPVMVLNHQLMVRCPPGLRPGMQLRIVVPTVKRRQRQEQWRSPWGEQMYEVEVPEGVSPGQKFGLTAGGKTVVAICPPLGPASRKCRFKLPIQLTADEIAAVHVRYETEDGWVRVLHPDQHLHWRRDAEAARPTTELAKWEANTAVVRQVTLRAPEAAADGAEPAPGPAGAAAAAAAAHPPAPPAPPPAAEGAAAAAAAAQQQQQQQQAPQQLIGLIEAQRYAIPSTCPPIENGASLAISASRYARMSFQMKEAWFRHQIGKVLVPWEHGHIKINVARHNVLSDSLHSVLSLGLGDLRKIIRFQFLNEPGIDAGGVAREWFEIASRELFAPEFGLWEYVGGALKINPMAAIAHEDYLRYFRFAGRLLGKALFDRQIVTGHLIRPLYKMILAWPLTLSDVKDLDADGDTYNSLSKLHAMSPEEIDSCYLDFSVTENVAGLPTVVELKPGGADIPVTADNMSEYLQLQMQRRLLGYCAHETRELLLGFYEVVPLALLTVFDYNELELMLCGMVEVDVDDWKENTAYAGSYERDGLCAPQIGWFWDLMEKVGTEKRAKFLQVRVLRTTTTNTTTTTTTATTTTSLLRCCAAALLRCCYYCSSPPRAATLRGTTYCYSN